MSANILSVFRANDIRGVYGRDFDLSFCGLLARSLRSLLCGRLLIERPRILIGHDARLSSPEIAASLALCLRGEGMDTANIGLAPSPLCYFLAQNQNLSAAAVVTASHNPPEYNGFKIMLNRKFNIPRPVQIMRDQLKAGLPRASGRAEGFRAEGGASRRRRRGSEWHLDPFAAYIDSLKREFCFRPPDLASDVEGGLPPGAGSSPGGGLLKPIPFVVDAGSGALGPLAKKALPALGLSPDFLFCEPDGRFPHHHPDPTIEENLTALKARVRETGAAFGAAFDGDGDRIVAVTGDGRTVLGDEFGFLFLPSLLSSRLPQGDASGVSQKTGSAGGAVSPAGAAEAPAQPDSRPLIIADVKCSGYLFRAIWDYGGRAFMSKSGHSLIREEMERQKAIFAVEFSGHVFFNDRPDRGFDDGLYAALRLVEILSRQNAGLSAAVPAAVPAAAPAAAPAAVPAAAPAAVPADGPAAVPAAVPAAAPAAAPAAVPAAVRPALSGPRALSQALSALLPKINSFRTGEIRKTLSEAEIQKALESVRAYLSKKGEDFNSLDGIRLSRSWEGGSCWALFRSSQTQNVLSMRFEASSRRGLAALKAEFSAVTGIELQRFPCQEKSGCLAGGNGK